VRDAVRAAGDRFQAADDLHQANVGQVQELEQQRMAVCRLVSG
jgi:hypothetical protein